LDRLSMGYKILCFPFSAGEGKLSIETKNPAEAGFYNIVT